MTATYQGFSKFQWTVLLMSGLILLIAVFNQIFGMGLLGIPLATFSVLSLFVSCLALWLFVAIDWPSILCLIGLGLLPTMSFGHIFTLSFGNTTFVFLLFTFILTHALEQTLFLKRVTAWAINNDWAQTSPTRFVLAFLAVMLFLASFISPTILFMIAFPLYEEMMQVFSLERGHRSASIILVALYATLAIGTAMTPINHVFAITAMGIYETAFNQVITNAQYMSFAIPGGIVIFLGLLLSLRFIWRLDLSDIQTKRLQSLEDLPEADRHERAIVAVFGLVVAMWLLPELFSSIVPTFATFFKQAGIAFPPMVGTLLLACLRIDGRPLITLQQTIAKGVYWPSLLIVAATLSLGTVLANPDFGVTSLIETQLTPMLMELSPLMMVFMFIAWAGIQTNFSSNLVTTTLVTTILTTLVLSNHDIMINTAVCASLIGFMASLAYMTPPSMPYVAISIGSGWTSSRDAFIYGGWLLLISILSATFVAYPVGSQLLSHLP